MNEVQNVSEVAKGISDYGMTVMTSAFFLILAACMMVAMFKWFKAIITNIIEQQADGMSKVLDSVQQSNRAMQQLLERLEPDTQLRIRNLTGFAFDLAVEQVCRIIKRVRKENHIADRAATAQKIRKLLQAIYDDRKSRFDPFSYHGSPLSNFCMNEWVEQVAQVVETEIYNEDGANDSRAYTNVKLAYDTIKTEFYQNIKS